MKVYRSVQIVLRIGGSTIGSPLNTALISQYIELLKRLKSEGHSLTVVVGGGTTAREFIKSAKELGLEEPKQDQLAIKISRVVAELLLEKLGCAACETVSTTLEDALECLRRKKIAVMGGLRPGITTDAVAALVVEKTHADILIKATDQEGIFDRDPKKYEDAIKLDRIGFEDLSRVLIENKHKAGMHQIIDPEAVKILKRIRVKVVVLNGSNPENVMKAVKGASIGTLVT